MQSTSTRAALRKDCGNSDFDMQLPEKWHQLFPREEFFSEHRKQPVPIGGGGPGAPEGLVPRVGTQGKGDELEETDTLLTVFECIGGTLVFHSMMIS